jgi:hypothetical protein
VPDDRDEGEPQTDRRYLLKRRVNWTQNDVCAMFVDAGAYNIDSYKGEIDPAMRFAHRRAVTIAGFKKLKELKIDPTPGSRSPYYLPDKMIEYHFDDGIKREELEETLRSLRRAFVFTVAPDGRYPNRTPKDILVLNEDAL